MKQISTEPTTENINRLLALLRESPAQLGGLNRSLSAEKQREPLREGEWSFKEHLAHLLSREDISSQSIYYALLVGNPVLPDIHPQRQWAPLVRYAHFPVQELLGYFSFRRETLLRVLADLTDAEWERAVSRATKRAESIYRLARSLALHEVEHLQDIASKLNKRL